MLKTVWLTDKRDISTGSAMLVGGFDGFHMGHRQLLSCAKQSNLPVGVMTIVGGKEKPLFTFEEREQIFKKAGVDFVFELPFAEIKDLTPSQFLELLLSQFHVKLFVCGEDFRFGKDAAGAPEDLKSGDHVRVEMKQLVTMYGVKVGSNTIKELLQNGKIEKANELLEEPFFVLGEVVADRKIGRTIGFPTANIEYPTDKFPLKQGVYETQVEIEGVVYKGITNYGARPTFDNERVLTETYLDGFSGDLYGKKLTVKFIRFLREIRKFDSIADLKNQLQDDIRRVRTND